MLNKKVLLLFGLIFLLFLACNSSKVKNENSVYVMIYDFENKPVKGTSFFLDGKLLGNSDINGRFIFELNDTEKHTILLKHDEYEPIEDTVVYEKFLVLYYKVGNVTQLLNLAEKELDLKKYEKAMEFINRAEKIDSTREDVLYLKAVIYYKSKDYESAKKEINKITITKENQKYISELKKRIENEN